MTIVIKRKNRRIGATIVLHDNKDILGNGLFYYSERWELECWSHGFVETFETKRLALSAMAHSDEWCPGCIEGWPIDDNVELSHVYAPASQREGGVR